MLYRVQVDVSFKEEKDVQSFITAMKTMAGKVEDAKAAGAGMSATLNTPMSIVYHKCYHDEATPKPCDGYVTVNIKG